MKLKDYLKHVPIRLSHFAKKVPICRPHLYNIMENRAQASTHMKRKIEIASEGNVKISDWPEKSTSSE